MKFRKILALFLLTAIMTSLVSVPASADGETPDVTISCLDELKSFRDNVIEGNNYQGKYIKLTADIDFGGSDEPWEPIGNGNTTFNGEFDGGGHSIAGLYINNSSDTQGLFGNTYTAQIKNLHVSGNVKGNDNVGGIVGVLSAGSIENCSYSGNVEGNEFVGGIVGFKINSKISGCYNTASVKGTKNIGGIAGDSYASISDSYNTGRITGDANVGGIVGFTYSATIKNCYNVGQLDSAMPIIGTNYNLQSKEENCYYLENTMSEAVLIISATKKITASDFTNKQTFSNWDFDDVWDLSNPLWGRPVLKNNKELIGTKENSYKISNRDGLETFKNFVSSGYTYQDEYIILAADIDLGGSSTPWEPIGDKNNCFNGTFDGNGHEITGLYISDSDSDTVGLFSCLGKDATIQNLGINGTIKGNSYAGGIAGQNNGTIRQCYVAGKIESEEAYAGGIAGQNTGEIENCYNKSEVSGSLSAGGISGNNTGKIKNCYDVGNINAESVRSGITGANDNGTISNCYYLSSSAKGGIAETDFQDSAEKFSTEQFITQSSFKNWNFDDVWDLSDLLIGRPLLKSVPEEDFGTEKNPYVIYDLKLLEVFRDYVKEGNGYQGKYIKLTADIDLGGSNNPWSTIGDTDNSFSGTFDGNGHKITGLYIFSETNDTQGLFANVYGTVKNLSLYGKVIALNGQCIGGIAGVLLGNIENCYNYCDVTGDEYVGGIAGINLFGKIESCGNIGDIKGNDYIGGIAGALVSVTYDSVKNSYNAAIITCLKGAGANAGPVAGKIGENEEPENCYYIENCGSEETIFSNTLGEEKSSEAFEKGEVAYLLKKGNTAWGQLLSGDNRDLYPIASNDSEKEVYKISFMTYGSNGYEATAFKYANKGGAVTLPAYDSEVFIGWSENASGDKILKDTYTLKEGQDASVYRISKNEVSIIGTPTEHAYDGRNVYDVSKLFDIDKNAGNAAYSIVSGGSGVGVLNGSNLTITKPGDFNIKVKTASTENYCPGEATATLTVKKGTPKEPIFPDASEITYGDKLSKSILSGGSSNGTFEWQDKDKILSVTGNKAKVIFTPNDSEFYDYSGTEIEKDISVKVNPRPVNITWKNTDNLVYDGEKKEITAEVSNKVGNDIVELKTSGDMSATDKGSYNAEVTEVLNENYTIVNGENIEKDWVIAEGTNVFTTALSMKGWIYGDIAQSPDAVSKFGTPKFSYSADGISYSEKRPEDAGTYYVKASVDGTPSYAELISEPVLFTIEKRDISEASVGKFDAMTYSGKEQLPNAKVTVGELEATGTWSKVTNVSDTTTFTASGNFTGTIENISAGMAKKNIENAVITLGEAPIYNAKNQTQEIENVTVELLILSEDDYDVSGDTATDVKADGNYILTISGKGNFEGEKTCEWNIVKATPVENTENKTTARVYKGKHLQEAIITDGEFLGVAGESLTGTFTWATPEKEISENGTEELIFNPDDTNYESIKIEASVSIYISGGSLGGATPCIVKFETNGGTIVSNKTVVKNRTLTEPAAPKRTGYTFEGWYKDKNLTEKYDFSEKVTNGFTLYAKWIEEENGETTDDKNEDIDQSADEQKPTLNEWKNPFRDINENDWFFGNIKYVNENGFMSGIASDEFGPEVPVTRGMLVTILYRIEGEPAINKSIPFADVNASQYYANAVIWAEQNDIVKGVSETEFTPDENITREQIATIIYRYAEYKGIAPTGAWAIKLDYADVADISDYAVEGVMYCTMKNIMQGKDNNMFAPKDNATRAEIAAILNRFIEKNK